MNQSIHMIITMRTADIVLSGSCLALGSGKFVRYGQRSIKLLDDGEVVKFVKYYKIHRVVVVHACEKDFVVMLVETTKDCCIVEIYDNNLSNIATRYIYAGDHTSVSEFLVLENLLVFHDADENKYVYDLEMRWGYYPQIIPSKDSDGEIESYAMLVGPNRFISYVMQSFSSLNKCNRVVMGETLYTVHQLPKLKPICNDIISIDFSSRVYNFYDKIIFTNKKRANPSNVPSYHLDLGSNYRMSKPYCIYVADKGVKEIACIHITRPYYPSVFVRVEVLYPGLFAIITENDTLFSVYLCSEANEYLPIFFNKHKKRCKYISVDNNRLVIQNDDTTFVYNNCLDFKSYLINTFRAVLKLSAIELPKDVIGEINAYF